MTLHKIQLQFRTLVTSIGFSLLVLLGVFVQPVTIYANESPPAEHGGGGEDGEGAAAVPQIPEGKSQLIETSPDSPSLKGPFIELKQINVVAIYRSQPVRHMNFIFVLEMENMEQWKFVLDRIEPVRSEIVMELHKIGSSQKGALLKDFDFLKQRLLATIERVIGPGHVKNVLIKASAGRVLPAYFKK